MMEGTVVDCTNMEDTNTSSEEVVGEKKSQKDSRKRKKHLIHQITAQMEFYFSSANITKDRFMASLIKDGPYVNLDTFFKFNRIRSLTTDINLLRKAVSKSSLLELSEDGLKVKRKFEVEVKDNEMECTIYIENIPAHSDHSWIREVLAQYGTIDYISLPRYRRSGKPKGFAFVEFKTPQMANSALEAFGALECRIPVTIDPSELLSIKSYEGNVEEEQLNTNEQGTPNKFICSLDLKQNAHKISDDKDTAFKMKTEVEERKIEVDDRMGEDVNRKRKEVEDKFEENDSEPNIHSAKKTKLDDAINKSASVTCTESGEVMEEGLSLGSKKKKKKRKRNKKEKEEIVESIYLRVMSKEDWKGLRNQYLNMQRENMKSLKRQLQERSNMQCDYSEYCNPNFIKIPEKWDRRENTASSVSNENQNSKPQFIPNAIIKISFEEPPQDPKKLRETIREGGSGGVAYVDVSATERDVFVRFLSEDAASAYKKSGCWSRMEVLSGTEEEEYWNRIISCWSQLRGRKNKQTGKGTLGYSNQVRGREKLLQKAFREAQNTKLNSHIVFED
ncbi:la-related protein 7 isoform X2 [Procambarus clarkii]